MADYLVKCHTPDNLDTDRRIQGLGGDWGWYSIDTIIHMIEYQKDFFWTYVNGKPAAVVVRQHGLLGRKYLQTLPDHYPENNLLKLPICGR